MATNTKIIKFKDGSITYVPVTIANAVQYSYTGGVMSVQEAIQRVAGVATQITNSVESVNGALNSHVGTTTQLTYTAGSGIGLSGAHANDTKIKVEGGDNIKINAVNTNEGIKISAYGLSSSSHNHNIGFTGDITLSSTLLSTSLQPTVNKSTNIKGGAAKKIAYQTAADTTGFINAPTTAGQVLKYDGSKIDWGTDNDTKLTSATVTVGSKENIADTTYSVNVIKSAQINMTGTNGQSVTGSAVYYTLPTQNAIDKAKEEAIAHADSLVVSAMNYRGVTTTSLSDGSTTSSIVIDGNTITPTSGDIVMSGTGADKKEFIWNGNSWNELGDVSAKANKNVKIEGTGELEGGGTLEANRTITHKTHTIAVVTPSNKDITDSASAQKVITGLTINEYGHITAYTAANIYSTDTNSDDFSKIAAGSDNTTTVTAGTVNTNQAAADSVGDTLTVKGGNKWITTGVDAENDTLFINHAIQSSSPAQNTEGVYAIKIDEAGHIISSHLTSVTSDLKYDVYDAGNVEFSLPLGTAEASNKTILTAFGNI